MFTKAERKKAKLRLALLGPAGSGKTRGALMLAMGLGGKIAMIDTEHGSGELYADLTDYDVLRLQPPYSPERYIAAIEEAAKAGYTTLIIDSLSHAWAGEGGILDMKDAAAKGSRSGNDFAAWRTITPEHNRLVEALLGSPLHLIITMRTKTAYEIQKDDSGKTKPVKIGLAPIQRDGLEYEFTVVLDLSIEGHIATSSKDRTRLFDGKHMALSPDVGTLLLQWLESGVDPYDIAKKKIASCKDLPALKDVWESLTKAERDACAAEKDKRKNELLAPQPEAA